MSFYVLSIANILLHLGVILIVWLTYRAVKLLERIADLLDHDDLEVCERAQEGSTEEITVNVLDRGSQDPATRYRCEVRSESGKRIVGTPCETVEKAIAAVLWDDLDREG
jgi:hypothetical protein